MANTFDPTMLDTASGRRLSKACGPCDPGAELTFTPEFLYFGYVPPGAVSEWQPFIIKNTGIVSVGVDALEFTGEFEIANADPVLLVPGESHTYSVRFAPTASGLRGGDITVTASAAGAQPIVKLMGIGGELAIAAAEGAGGAGSAWAYRYGAFAVSNIAADEILMDYHVTTAHRLQSNFAGCKASMTVPPLVDFYAKVLVNDLQVGSIAFNLDATVVLITNGGSSVIVPINSIVTVKAPPEIDAQISRIRMTFVGVV
jgi:hypothetical protein